MYDELNERCGNSIDITLCITNDLIGCSATEETESDCRGVPHSLAVVLRKVPILSVIS
jgi:hypothetical protein